MGSEEPDRKTELARRLRAKRLRRGLKQTEMADELGVGYETYVSWERRKAFPEIDTLRAVAEKLDPTLLELAAEDVVDKSALGGMLAPLEEEVRSLRLMVEELRATVAELAGEVRRVPRR